MPAKILIHRGPDGYLAECRERMTCVPMPTPIEAVRELLGDLDVGDAFQLERDAADPDGDAWRGSR